MTPTSLIRASGLAAIGAGLMFVGFPLLHPNHDVAGYTSVIWVPAHLSINLGALLVLFGLIGLFVRQLEQAGWFGLVGFVAAFIGTASMLMGAMIEMFIIPFLSLQQPGIEDGPPPPGVGEAFMTIQVIFWIGYMLLGTATLRAGVLPRSVGVMLLLGPTWMTWGEAVTLRLGGDDSLWAIGFVLLGASYLWLGYTLYADPSPKPLRRRPRVVDVQKPAAAGASGTS